MSVSALVGSGLFSLATVLAAIPPVLDGVVASVLHVAGDLSPLLAHHLDHFFDPPALLLGDRLVVKLGLEVLVPPLTALLWRPGLQDVRYLHPFSGAFLPDKVSEALVLGSTPRSSLLLSGAA